MLGSLDRVPAWAIRAPESSPPGDAFPGYMGGRAGRLPREWSEWENYVERIVSRYRGLIHRWEAGSEMNSLGWLIPPKGMTQAEAYFELLKHTYPIVKDANPQAVVVGFAVSREFRAGDRKLWEFINGVLDRGGLRYTDVVSYHAYIRGAIDERSKDSPSEWVPRLRDRMRELGGEKPIICSEGGFADPGSCLKYRPATASVRAWEMPKFLVRQYISQWFAGVERFYFYTSGISGQPVKQAFYGFIEGDGQPIPNMAAYATMTWLLDAARPDVESPRAKRGPNLWVYPFTTPGGTILVVCARTGTVQQLRLPNATRLWDLMGAERNVPKDRKLTVTDALMYVMLNNRSD